MQEAVGRDNLLTPGRVTKRTVSNTRPAKIVQIPMKAQIREALKCYECEGVGELLAPRPNKKT